MNQWVAIGGTVIATIIATLTFLRVWRKEAKEANTNAANLAAGHLNTLSAQLMQEREASEARFNRMQDRADRLADKVDDLERAGHDRDVEVSKLYLYITELENVIRATGLATPQRPDGLVILPGKKT